MTAPTDDQRLPVGLPDTKGDEFKTAFDECVQSNSDHAQRWHQLIGIMDRFGVAAEFRPLLIERCLQDWPTETHGPIPHWFPIAHARKSNIAKFSQQSGLANIQQMHDFSVRSPNEFWQSVCDDLDIVFQQTPECVVANDAEFHSPNWFPGGRFNIVDSCFTADPELPAIVSSDDNGKLQRVSFGELEILTKQVASGLIAAGFAPSDAIAIFMPMTVQCVAIYLGIIRAGCVVVSIADSFAAEAVSQRLEIANAKGIFCQHEFQRSGRTINLYDRVWAADAPRAIVLSHAQSEPTLRDGDINFAEFVSKPTGGDAVSGTAKTWINILFSSGTTGDPKAIPWTHSTALKAAMDGRFHQDIQQGDTVCWPTNIGWMMGPWLIFASLINKATIALYNDAPVGAGFATFIQQAGVTMLGVIPTLVKAWRSSGCLEDSDWTGIQTLSSTGEVSSPDDMAWLMSICGHKPVIEYCGGTEIGGGYISSSVAEPNRPSCFTMPTFGNCFEILDDTGQSATTGEVFLHAPAIGLSTELVNRDHNKTYFEDSPVDQNGQPLRRHGDWLTQLAPGVYSVGGRTDDTMNLGGIKVGTGEIEQTILAEVPLKEVAAIGLPATGGGPTLLVIFAVLQAKAAPSKVASQNDATPLATQPTDDTRKELLDQINVALRTKLNPLFRAQELRLVKTLPRTASNKIMRRVLRESI